MTDVPDVVRERLRAVGDPSRVPGAQAYLKTDQVMFGVSAPAFHAVMRALARERPPAGREVWEREIGALWEGPEREVWYAAIAWGRAFPRRQFLDLAVVPLLERMVREGAWWDLVDGIAVKLVGTVVSAHREEMRPVLDRWIEDPDLWIRRTAILAQHDHRAATDVAQLLDYCRRQAADKTFWIRKAIGWALRQHAKTDPDVVRAFLAEMGQDLSGLSRREAAKHL